MFFGDYRKDEVIFQERSPGSTKVVRIVASLAYMTCSSNDMSQDTRFRSMFDR